MTAIDGVQETPPIWWHSYAGAINAEPSGITDGRYVEPVGEVWGGPVPTFQDTYLSGTAGRSGLAFTALVGTWKDDFVSPWSDKYALLQPDSTLAAWGIRETTQTSAGLTPRLVVIRMGIAPAASGAAHLAANNFAYLELADDSTINYRLAFEYGKPIRLDYQDGTTNGWLPYAHAKKLGNLETYLARNDNEIRLHILPDTKRGLLLVEIGDGHWLRGPAPRPARPDRLSDPGALPSTQRYYWSGQYRWSSLEVYPLTFASPSVSKSKRHFGNERLSNLQGAQVIANFAGEEDGSQRVTGAFTPDGQGNLSYTATFSTSGGTVAPRFADILIYIPSSWSFQMRGYPLPEARLSVLQGRLLEVWDDATRMGMSAGRLLVSNRTGFYSGAFGNYALNLTMGNGQRYDQMMRGVIGCDPDGIKVGRKDPIRAAELPIRDFWAKLATTTLNQEVTLDGLCIYTAIRHLLDIGQVHPDVYGVTIPRTGFPPAGGYPDGFPFFILGKGTGLSPKYRYPPNVTVLSVLQDLIQDSGDPDTGYPHYMWFDTGGQFHWEPYRPQFQPVVHFYSDTDTSGQGAILDFAVYNSIAQLRTGVTVQGQDAWTYELLQYSLPLPGNLGAVGYQLWELERNARYASPAYMERITQILARQASLPTQIVRMRVPFWPHVHAGQVIAIQESQAMKRVGLFTVLEIDSIVGHDMPYFGPGNTHCYSWITARSIENAIL